MPDTLFQTEPTVDPFGQVPTGPTTVSPDPKQTDRVARMAGLANSDPHAGDLVGQIDANTKAAQDTIQNLGELQLRRQVAAKQMSEDLTSLIAEKGRYQNDPQIDADFNGAIAAATQKNIEKRMESALEQQTVERIQDLAATDPSQARALLNGLTEGNITSVIRDTNTKQLILDREIAAAEADVQHRPWFASVASFVLSAVPWYTTTGQDGLVPTMKRWYDSTFSGDVLQRQSSALMNMPVDQFTPFVRDVLIPRLKEESTFLGFYDQSKALSTLTKLNKPTGLLTENSGNTLDNFGWVGPAELTKAVSIPGQLVRNGARKTAVDQIVRHYVDISTHGAETATVRGGLEMDEVVDHMLPSAVNPEAAPVAQASVAPTTAKTYFTDANQAYEHFATAPSGSNIDFDSKTQRYVVEIPAGETKPGIPPTTGGVSSQVSTSGEVNEAVDRINAVTAKFQELNQVGTLTDPEMQLAIQKTIEQVKEAHGDIIHDVGVRDIQLANNTVVKRVEFTVGNFSTPEKALEYAQVMGLGPNVELQGWDTIADRKVRLVPGLSVSKQPGFQQWFSKSKVVDESGKPIPMWHGIKENLWNTERKWGTWLSKNYSHYPHKAMFFAENPKTAEAFSHGPTWNKELYHGTMPFYVNATNPFDPVKNAAHAAKYRAFLEIPENYKKVFAAGWHDYAGQIDEKNIKNALTGNWSIMESQPVQDWIHLQEGHDGYYVWSQSEGRNLAVYDVDNQVVNAITPTELENKVVRDESGSFSFKYSTDVAETGFITNTVNNTATGKISRFLLSARAIGDALLGNQAQSAGNTRAKIMASLHKDYTAKLSRLSKPEREATSQILAAGENLGKWFTPDEQEQLWQRAFNRPPTVKESEAYQLARNLNDVEWALRNDVLYREGVIRGKKSVSLWYGDHNLDGVNAHVSDKWHIKSDDRVMVVDGDKITTYHKANPMSDQLQSDLREQGFNLVLLDQPVDSPAGGIKVRAVLAKKSDMTIENLRRDQLPYRAGGHRMYSEKYFVKQAVIGSDAAGSYMKNPNTYVVGTKAEVEYYASGMEMARSMWLRGLDSASIQEVLPAGVKVEDFISNMENGVFQKDTPFHAVFDREILPEYQAHPDWTDLQGEESDIESFMRSSGRMYYSPKGQTLTDWKGQMAPTLDPFKVIERSLSNVANLSSFSDYKISAANRWYNTFGGYLSQAGVEPTIALRDGQFAHGTPERIVQAGEAQREIIKRTLGWQTEFDRQSEIYARRFGEFVSGDNPYSTRSKAATAFGHWWNTNNPVSALRGAVFDLKLGLFNIAQFPLQIGTAIAATTISPVHGIRGFINYMPLRTYLTRSGTEHMLDTLVSNGAHRLSGFDDPAEYKAFMKQAKSSGFFNIDQNHILVNDHGFNAVGGFFSKDSFLRSKGRIPFNEGEIMNRAVAWRIAWGETKEKFPELAIDSNDFKSALAGRAEEYAWSMSEQSAAAWQKGITSIPTQFWAYQTRMLEAMFGPTFSREQRVRLILGQTLLYGSAGLPIMPYISEKIKEHTGEPAKLGTLNGWADRGLVDNAIFELAGQDWMVGARYGTGSFLSDTIKNLLGNSQYGETSAADIFGGATWSIGTDALKTLGDVGKYVVAESGGDLGQPIPKEAWVRLASNVSTLSNAHKAYLAFQYGTLVSGKGTTVATGLESADAFAIAMGISPGEADQLTAHMLFYKNESQAVDEATKVINNYRTKYFNEPDNRADIEQELNAYIKLLPPNIAQQARQKAHGQISGSLLEGISQRVLEDKARADMYKRFEQEDNQ